MNPGCAGHNFINKRVALHFDALSLPCRASRWPSTFIRRLPGNGNGTGPATYLSIKDQSGHEVNCILRSIFTDLVHNTVLQKSDVEAIRAGHRGTQ